MNPTPPTPPRTTEQPGAVKADCSDAELSAAVAAYIVGWSINHPVGYHTAPDGLVMCQSSLPSFATSADAVLPLLEKHSRWEINYVGDAKWKDRAYCCEVNGFKSMAPTFTRAACFSLLRAASVTVTGSAQEAGK